MQQTTRHNGACWQKRLNLDDLPFDLFSQGKDADGVTTDEGPSWRTRVKKMHSCPVVVDRIMGMTVHKTIQRWEFTFNAFFQANGGSPPMDKANFKARNIDDPFSWQQRPDFPRVHIPGNGDQIPSLEKTDYALINKIPCVQNHIRVSEMGQDNPFQLLGWLSEMGIRNHADLHLYHQISSISPTTKYSQVSRDNPGGVF